MSFDIAGIIGSSAQMVNDNIVNVANAQATRAANKKSRDFAREMSLWAYNKDLEQWNRANEYNSPLNQMRRLQEAGLNPRLMYGQGTTGNTTTGTPHMEVPKGQFIPPQIQKSNFLGNYLDFTIKSKQAEILNEEKDSRVIDNITKVIRMVQETGVQSGNIPGKYSSDAEKSAYKLFHEHEGVSSWDWQINQAQTRNELMKSQISKLFQDTEYQKMAVKYLTNKYNTLQDSGVNVDRDSLLERTIGKEFGGSGVMANSWAKTLFQLLLGAMGKM